MELERGKSLDALILEIYPDSPEAIRLNNKGIYLKPKYGLRSIDEVSKWCVMD